MPEVYCVRAEYGSYTKYFIEGGYVAIGWTNVHDLSNVHTKDELYPIYKQAYPNETSNLVVGQGVGQMARFLFDIKAGDYVIKPDPSYFYAKDKDGCPYLHRRHVKWYKDPVKRSQFSVPFQNTIRSSLAVFWISQTEHFFEVIGEKEVNPHTEKETYDPYRAVLDQLLELNDKEFEIPDPSAPKRMGEWTKN